LAQALQKIRLVDREIEPSPDLSPPDRAYSTKVLKSVSFKGSIITNRELEMLAKSRVLHSSFFLGLHGKPVGLVIYTY
jgi:hypothetical protein